MSGIKTRDDNAYASTKREVALCILALVLTVFSMYWFITYPYPNEKHPTISEFLIFYLREVILFGFIVIGLVATIFAKLLRFFRRGVTCRDEPQ